MSHGKLQRVTFADSICGLRFITCLHENKTDSSHSAVTIVATGLTLLSSSTSETVAGVLPACE
jgi:hypothetical protein